MAELTKEWLLKTIAELEEERDAVPGIVNEDAAMALAAMKLALASLEAEAGVNHQPVAWQYKEYVHVRGLGYLWREKLDCEFPGAECETLKDVVPLYTAPPAPVYVMDEKQSRELFENWCSVNIERNKWHPEYYAHYPATGQWRAWEACRTAMLQGADGNSPVIPDGWVMVPVNATRAMIDAARRVEEDGYDAMHKAMIAAAPQQEVK
ncbi:hypothetical protein [Enterobacter hormaechei]|uniref:hypothetical protein n=1 Tax=Enterobacter cloacae complex TaxID=354276 RepID=UPI002854EB8F|nr:hypothetical protein [Enterobacter hormaechei]ELD3313607.1 hypothetical protein [Enterobacter hormaechei]ELD3471557.1 hypothetical protein [Enterobacter hormaechei]ELD3484424.1 hypothetical protein [Enterobacter hormaechei]MDR9958862.1 hypothetical protein [Enterobacter hormaechei subsp. xiangfangensis]MDS0074618.1 hypothetical protein [Enterobacter hormaechei subsp. xiangfangensis]